MNRVQAGLLNLLREIDTICKENDIVYYVTGGTAIGAVRHKGFIPWDDDIDVYMTRSNWEKFHNVMKKNPPDRRVLQYWADNTEYNNLIGRYTNLDSTQIYKSQLYSDIAKGQVIDVFILDPIIGNQEAISSYRRTVMLIGDIINEFYIYSKSLYTCDEYSDLYAKVKKYGKYAVVSELIPELEKYNEDESDYYILRWGGLPHLFKKEMFAEPKYLEFEDTEVPLPTTLSDHLVQLYGLDWMYLPPVQYRDDHGTIADPDRAYDEIDSVISSKVNGDLVVSKLTERKRITLDNLKQIHDANERILRTEGEVIKRRSLWHIENEGISKDDLEGIRPYVTSYVELQASKFYIGNNMAGRLYEKTHPIYVDIGDDVLEAVLNLLIIDHRIGKADRILQIRFSNVERELTPALKDMQKMFGKLKTVQNLIEFKNYQAAEQIVDELIKLTPNVEVYKYKLYLMEMVGKESSEEFSNVLTSCISKWPNEADFCKFLGDFNTARGESEAAAINYEKTMSESSNGILLLDLKKKLHRNESSTRKTIQSKTDKNEQSSLGENRYFKLLTELIKICEDNQIEYFTGGGILYYLMDKEDSLPADFSSMEIVVDGYNAGKLLEALKELPDNRAIECVLSNPKLRNLDILYFDTEAASVDFAGLDRRQKLRVSIPIRIARPDGKTTKNDPIATLEKYWRINYSYHFGSPKQTEAERRKFAFAKKAFRNGDRLTKYLFKQNMNRKIKEENEVIYIYDDKTLKSYPAMQWNNKTKTEFLSVPMCVPGDIEAYLNKRCKSLEKVQKNQTHITDQQFIDIKFEEKLYHDDAFWDALLLSHWQKTTNRYYTQEYDHDWKMAEDIFKELSVGNL